MSRHGARFLLALAVASLAGCAKSDPDNNAAFRAGQAKAARQLTAERMVQFVAYERAMRPAYWQRTAFTLEADLMRRGKLPSVPGTFEARQERLSAAHQAASEKAGLTAADAMGLYNLALVYYPSHFILASNERAFPILQAGLDALRADGGAPAVVAKRQALLTQDRADDLATRQKLASFEQQFGKKTAELLAAQAPAIDELWTNPPPMDPELQPIIEAGVASQRAHLRASE